MDRSTETLVCCHGSPVSRPRQGAHSQRAMWSSWFLARAAQANHGIENYVEEELTKRSSRWQLHGEKHLGPVQPTVNRRIMCRLGKVTGECRRTLQAISNRQAYPGDLERHLQLPDGRSPDVPVKTLAKVRQQFYWH
ncbi:hypothetical protein T08_3859 [Trichinella sp. T8]|nr:hypothetical protein T08_3859 [Trichinella sp. T8]